MDYDVSSDDIDEELAESDASDSGDASSSDGTSSEDDAGAAVNGGSSAGKEAITPKLPPPVGVTILAPGSSVKQNAEMARLLRLPR